MTSPSIPVDLLEQLEINTYRNVWFTKMIQFLNLSLTPAIF